MSGGIPTVELMILQHGHDERTAMPIRMRELLTHLIYLYGVLLQAGSSCLADYKVLRRQSTTSPALAMS